MEQTQDLSIICCSSIAAGFIARFICHPVDTTKARMQAIEGRSIGGVFSSLRSVFMIEGWRGLYRGFPVVALGGTPATCIYLTTYEVSSIIYIFVFLFECGMEQKISNQI